ncbi:MAG: tetratricopeptide repeat protein, partial [Candidatus Omnitrophica bacterium]|nr:tetratricopeptide repeat protein [Candidatus Omnitrophota bacterium]
MMGINDSAIRYYQDIPESDTWLFKHCRVYRFARIMGVHILKKIRREDLYRLDGVAVDGKGRVDGTRSVVEKQNVVSGTLPGKNEKADWDAGERNLGPRNSYSNHDDLSENGKFLREALKPNPENNNADVEAGRLYREQGEFSKAEELLRRALELNPKNDEASVELGWLYREQGEFSKAEELLRRALELNPENENAYFKLGKLYLDQSKFLQAESLFQRALELDPKSDSTCFELGRLYRIQVKLT